MNAWDVFQKFHYKRQYQNLQTKNDTKKSLQKRKFQAISFKYTWKTPSSYLYRVFLGFWLGGLGFQFLWDLIFLLKFGYRNKFIHMIQVAFINIQSKTEINGLLSNYFTLIQGFHQDCPLSMLLCIILAEVLAIFIDTNQRYTDRRPWK